MADHAITLADNQPGPSPDGMGFVYEDVQVIGTGGTTGVYTTNFVKTPERVIGGPFTFTFSGQDVTFNSAALTGTTWARIIGFA